MEKLMRLVNNYVRVSSPMLYSPTADFLDHEGRAAAADLAPLTERVAS